MVLVKISFLRCVSVFVFVFASKKHPENDKMNGKLNIVGINTYVYRFEMLWLSLLDHFLFLSLSLFVCVYLYIYVSVLFGAFLYFWHFGKQLYSAFHLFWYLVCLHWYWFSFCRHIDLAISFNACVHSVFFSLVFAFFLENILATWGFFFVAFVSYIICAFENVFKHTATTKRTIIVEIVFHSARQTRWANCAFQPCLFRWIINISFIVFDTKSFFRFNTHSNFMCIIFLMSILIFPQFDIFSILNFFSIPNFPQSHFSRNQNLLHNNTKISFSPPKYLNYVLKSHFHADLSQRHLFYESDKKRRTIIWEQYTQYLK